MADAPEGRGRYLALFNTGEAPAGADKDVNGEHNNERVKPLDYHGPSRAVPVKLADLGFKGECVVRDLWAKQGLGTFQDEFAPQLPLHGAGLYLVREKK